MSELKNNADYYIINTFGPTSWYALYFVSNNTKIDIWMRLFTIQGNTETEHN